MKNKKELPEDLIVELYTKQNITATEIAKTYNVSSATILNLLKDHQVPIKHNRGKGNRDINSYHKKVWGESDIQEMIRFYTIEHLTSTEIGKRFGITFSTVISILRKNNVPILDSRHDKSTMKVKIKQTEVPNLIKNYDGKYGDINCPDCGKIRHRVITRPIIKEIIKNNGKCNQCIHRARAKDIDINEIKYLYHDKHLTAQQIGKIFNMSYHSILKRMKDNGISIRIRGGTNKIQYIDKIRLNNKGTIKNPIVGDMCEGSEIGLNESYYTYIECPKCHKTRWQGRSHYNDGKICRDCYNNPTLDNRGTIEHPILDDIVRGSWINKRGRFYIFTECAECHKTRWELLSHDNTKIHLCNKCSYVIRGLTHRGEKANGWKGGLTLIEYPQEWNNKLKNIIRGRDNNTCQLCGHEHQDGEFNMAVHHIDYNKKNLHPNNLISLCSQKVNTCHIQTNFNREYWPNFFINLLKDRGLYINERNQFMFF